MNNIVENLRKVVVEDLFNTSTFNKCWDVWVNDVHKFIGETPTPQSILNLGDHLSEIFTTTGTSGRDQSDLSGGGTAWECLIVWYLNLCFSGTRVVACKKMSHVPSPIRDAITVNYSNFSCTTESDITIVVFPDDVKYTTDPSQFMKSKGTKIDMEKLSEAVTMDFSDFEIGIIQCKTNWNDNAQIPMLWDMIYSAGGFGKRQISLGRNGFSLSDIPFTYSFVTVPSNKKAIYKFTSLAVKRVINLSGGNYWGKETQNGIARSVKEIFHNYRGGYQNGVIKNTLPSLIEGLDSDFSYFNI